MSAVSSLRSRRASSSRLDETVLRWLFRTVIAVTVGVLAADFATMNGWIPQPDIALTPAEQRDASPMPGLPAILAPFLRESDRRLMPMPQPDGALGKAMTFELASGGRLLASGTITPGSFDRFADEVVRRAEYIRTVVLNSPGGSVGDAIAMGRLIRDKKFATEVEAGKYCASSCPLAFAGGVERRAGEKAAIGVHQVFAMGATKDVGAGARDEMGDAQKISARCQRYLGEMGIDLRVWVHAMDTPKDKLFVFNAEELKTLNIVTASTPVANAPPSPPSKRN